MGQQPTSPSKRVSELIRARDQAGLEKEFLVSTVIALPAPERDKVAVALAETLLLNDGLPAMDHKDFPGNLPMNPVYGLKSYAITLLTVLAEQRLITVPKVLPGLIAALSHPDHNIARDSHRALVALTGHTTGTVYWPYWPHKPQGAPGRAETLAWWQNWWAQNKDRQPVFTPALEARLQQTVARLASAIATDLKEKQPGRFPELARFTVRPSEVERRNIEFLPLHWHRSVLQVKESLDIFIRVRTRFGTPDLAAGEGEGGSEDRDPLALAEQPQVMGLRKVRQRIYGGYLPDTDLRIEVEMATHNTTLLNAARTVLAKTAATEGLLIDLRFAYESRGSGKPETPEETARPQQISALSDAVENADVKSVERAFARGTRYPASELGGLVITCIGEAYDPLRSQNDPKRERFRAIAKFLLRRGAAPSERDGNQGTALHHAALYGDIELCALLLDYKADRDARDKVNETPLTTAATFNQAKVVELLIRRGTNLRKYGHVALWTAAYNDGYETVELLARHGVDITTRDTKGRTAEDLARERGFLRCAQRIAALTRALGRQAGKRKPER